MTKCLIAEYETTVAAKVALEALEREHFTLENVSVVSSASDSAAERLHDLHEDDSEQATAISAPEGRSTSLGMLIGGTLAAPIAAGTMVGPFIIAGPLVGMALGAAIGRLFGGMEQWGVARDVSADYEQRVKSGAVLVIVHHGDSTRLQQADEVLQSTDPESLEKYEVR